MFLVLMLVYSFLYIKLYCYETQPLQYADFKDDMHEEECTI